MQERIDAYMQTLTVKGKSGYELAARVCAIYFDGRGIAYPTAEDWKAFEEYYPPVYLSEKGKELNPVTLQQNYVARGKAFYRWCYEQDNPRADADIQPGLFEEEESPPVTQSVTSPVNEEAEKPVRVNFLLSKGHHEALMSLVYLKDTTLTAILTEAIEAYIQGYSEEIAVLRETRRRLRSK